MPDNIETFGFDKEEIKGGRYDKYKAKKSSKDRLGVVYTDPNAMFAGSKVHFKERYFLCKNGICCENCGPAKWRVGAVVVKYATNLDGTLKEPFEWSLLPWLFSEQGYIKLKNVNGEFPLASHDINISCTNEEYQHIDITPCKESIWQAKESLKKEVLDGAKPIWDYIKKSIASDLSIEEIRDLLGMQTQGGSDPTTNINLDQVLDNV